MSEQQEVTLFVAERRLDLVAAMRLHQDYLDACKALLSDSDYAVVRGRKFRKRSGWSKLRRVFAVTCEVIHEERIEITDDWGYLFTVRATLPSGRYEEADGMCMFSEELSDRKAPTLHDIRAKALTRAKNRVTSDILGAGIVSAEEEHGSDAPWTDDARTTKAFWVWVKGTLGLIEDEVHGHLGVDHLRDYKGSKQRAVEVLRRAAQEKGAKRDADHEK